MSSAQPANVAKESKVLCMQKRIRDFFDHYRKDQIPNNLKDLGCFETDEGKATQLGIEHYNELSSLHTYLSRANPKALKGFNPTILDAINDTKRYPPKEFASDDEHKAEFAVIIWLGSNEGQKFLREYAESTGQKLTKR